MSVVGRIFLVIAMCIGMVCLCACGQEENTSSIEGKDYETILQESKGKKVNFYAWGGDSKINSFIDKTLAEELKKKYDITLNHIPQDIDQTLNQLISAKEAGRKSSSIDLVWINGENFLIAKENNLLSGPLIDKVPNYKQYLDPNDLENTVDFGNPTEGFIVPYGRAQLVFIGDTTRDGPMPYDKESFKEFVMKNPGKVTYPVVNDFTGGAFVRNLITETCGEIDFSEIPTDKEALKKRLEPLVDYLKDIKPYLWREGKTYPSTLAQLDSMYQGGEVILMMSYTPYLYVDKVATGAYSKDSKSFIFSSGSIGNTHYLGIPQTSANKEAALVVINYLLSPEVQALKYQPEIWGDLPVVDTEKLTTEEKALFKPLNIKGATKEELEENRRVEIPSRLIPLVEEIWKEEILSE